MAIQVSKDKGALSSAWASDHTSVSRWLSGEQPNAPGPELIAEILTEMIGRRVTVGELTILEQDRTVAADQQEQEAASTKKGQDRAAHDPLFFHGAFM